MLILKKIIGHKATSLIAIILCFIGGFALSDCQAQAKYSALLELSTEQHTEISVTKNKTKTLEASLADLSDENTKLIDLVKTLKDKPADIRYITRTETVLKASDPIIMVNDLPEEYIYKLNDQIAVARFAKEQDQFIFETYDLVFRNTIVTGKKSTSALLQVQSSANPNTYYDVPVTVDVRKINQQKLFEPHIGLGITGSLPVPAVTASLMLYPFHPLEELDAAVLRLSANSKTLKVGLDPIAYNLGHRIPVITDTWISIGPSVDIAGQFSADLTLSTKF